MSCAGRGTTREPRDFYPTPWPAFGPLIPFLRCFHDDAGPMHFVNYYDPCAGDGRIIHWMKTHGRDCEGSDLYPQENQFRECQHYDLTPVDYLKDNTPRDFVLTNPPFGVAFEMCQHARKTAKSFAFLLRLSFLESDERGDWFDKNEPNGLFVLKKRPPFVMSVTCKSVMKVAGESAACRHNWILPLEAERPKECPRCGGKKLAISTSDSSGYAWMIWSDAPQLQGIHHI